MRKLATIALLFITFGLFAQSATLTDNGTTISLNNGIVNITIQKTNGQVTSYLYKGFQLTTGNIYYSMDGGSNYRQPANCVFSVKTNTADLIDVSFKSIWTAQLRPQAFDIDIHYVLQKGKSGIYTYAILDHPANYPATSVGEWRTVWKLNQDQVEYICVDSLRHWKMPTKADYAASEPTAIAEVRKLVTGEWAGKYDCKYMYNKEYFEVGAYGHASNVNKIGQFAVFGGYDFFNDGPTHTDLTSADNIIHVHLGMNHFGGSSTSVEAGEAWSKIYGPIFYYANSNPNGAKACWDDALNQAKVEKAAWPYSWLTNTTQYPAKNQRGTVTGKLLINDPYKSNTKGQNAKVGLVVPGTDWQNDSKNYQYWVKTNADGSFTIPNVRPGTYELHAVSDGVVEEFEKANVTVSANTTNNQGTVQWNIVRNKGELIWEIGVPNRSANEFFHGNDYFKPFLWEQFSKELPNPINFTIGQSDWSKDWNYAHCAYLKDGVNNEWRWNVLFNLPNAPTKDLTLTIAFASAHYPRLNLYVNGALHGRVNISVSGGNALIREGIHAKYSYTQITIPASKLKKGANSIGFAEFTVTQMFAHVMYDYIALEGFVTAPAKPEVSSVAYCQNTTALPITAVGSGLKWYSSINSATPLASAPIPSTAIAGNFSYFVTQTVNGIESERAEIQITINPSPVLTHNTRTETRAWTQVNTFTVCVGENVSTGPWPNVATGWSWTGPNGFSSTLRNPALDNMTTSKAGVYKATYTDIKGCAASLDLTIVVSAPTASITSPTNSFCTGGNVVLTANTGTSYVWRNGTTTVGTAPTYAAKTTGSYTVIVTNASGCKDTSAVKAITENPLPVLTHNTRTDNVTWAQQQSFTACVGDNVYTGPWPNLATGWSWSGPNNFSSTLRNPILSSISSNQAGKYTATYTDPKGCSASLDLTIVVSVPTATISSPTNSFCTGGNVVLTANTGISYVWRNGTTAVGTAASYTAKTAGSYNVIVANANGCKDTSLARTITANLVPVVSITSPANNATLTSDVFPINATVTGTNISNVTFYNGSTLFGTDATSPYSFTTPSLANGTYTFSAIAKNTFNCTDTAKVTVKVNKVVTAINENEISTNIQCFPNPFQDNLNLKVNGLFNYTIFDMLGNEIEKGIGTEDISVGHTLPNGLYVIKIKTEKLERSFKVSKVR